MIVRRPGLRVGCALLAAAAARSVAGASAAPPAPAWGATLFATEAEPRAASPEAKRRCSDPRTRARLARCFPRLLVHDAGRVFTAPARWKGREWGFFASGLVGMGALLLADDGLRAAVLRNPGGAGDTIAKIFEPLGMQGSFAVIGGFFFGGLAAHDEKAKGAGLDAFAASIIAGGIITPVIKEIAGRSRPNAGEGPYHFEPFRGGPSFPSGHPTQAFAVASAIATDYPAPWVQAACYVPASLVLYARMRHDAHWASDVAAGALIGYGVGHGIARLNLPLRMGERRVQVLPLAARRGSGALLTARF